MEFVSPQSRFGVLNDAELQQAHDASIKILKETGVIFHSEEVLDIFREHGARVEGEKVYISEEMVQDCLESAPSSFEWEAVNQDNSLTIGQGQKRVAVSPNQGPVYIQDIDDGRRESTLEDLINVFKLCQSSEVVNTVGGFPVEPNDVEDEAKHLQLVYQLLKHTDKPLIGIIRDQEEQHQIFDMIELAVGEKNYLDDHAMIAVSINPLSPLRFGDEQLETVLAYAKQGQPVFVLPCILAGATGPVSLFGTTVLQNVEILAGIVLTQLINPGTPVVYSPASSTANMQTASYITGSPEANLMNVACMQLGFDVYELPTRSMAGLTDAKVVDCQAGYETMQNFMMLMLAGTHIINESLGVLDSIMTTSYEKFIIDEEMIDRVIRIQQGIDTSNADEDVEVIQDVAHSGKYLMHQNTLEHFRERWEPTVSCWDSYDDWKETGAEDVVLKANQKYKERLENAPESLVDEELDKKLKDYMNSILKK